MNPRTTLLALVLAVAAASTTSLAQVALVAHTSGTNTSGGTGTIDTTGANFIAVCEAGNSPVTPVDSVAANVYTLVASIPQPGYWGVHLYVSYNPTTSKAQSWKVAGGAFPTTVLAYSGVASLDKVSTLAGGGATLTVPGITPAAANELILGCFWPQATAAPLTTIDSVGDRSGIASASIIQTAPQPVTAIWSESNGNGGPSAGLTASFFSILNPAPLTVRTENLPEAFVGALYKSTLTAAGGIPPYKWAGTLPAGLTLSPDGALGGSPAAAGTSPAVLTVADSKGKTATFNTTVRIAASPLAVSTSTCPSGTQYQPYSCTIEASGGSAPLTISWAGQVPWTGQQPPAGGDYSTIPEGLTMNAAGAISGTLKGQGVYTALIVVTDAAGTQVTRPVAFNITADNSMAGCAYPADSIYRVNVATLPVDTSPAAAIYSAYVRSPIRIGFGQYGHSPDGIGFYRVPYNQPMVPVATGLSTFPGDRGPIPYDAPMENTRNSPGGSPPETHYTGDNHVSILQTAGGGKGCFEWSTYNIYNNVPDKGNHSWGDGAGTGNGYSDFYADMSKYNLIPQGQPGADAGGLPIIPFLENYDEVLGTGKPGAENGVVDEPKRFTLNHTANNYVWPARHQAGLNSQCVGGYRDPTGTGQISQLSPPTACTGLTGPIGEIYRLKASVPNPSCAASSPQARIIMQGFRDHGIILADNGISGALIGTPDTRWNLNDLSCLSSLHLTDFEPVKVEQLAVDWLRSTRLKPGSPISHASVPPGSTSITITATDSSDPPQTVTRTFAIPLLTAGAPNPPAITLATLPEASVGGEFSQPITLSGGTAPFAFSLASGTLPPGLTLSAAGLLSGHPTTPGSFTFAITATDAHKLTAAQNYTLAVAIPELDITTPTLPALTIGQSYAAGLAVTGGKGPVKFSATGLPPGMKIDPATGQITGTPTQ